MMKIGILICLLFLFPLLGNSQRNFLSLERAFEVPDSVYSLNLRDQQLTSIPDSITKFVNLTELYLEGNYLTKLPDSIGKLTNLMILDISDNHISELPESIGNCSKL